jgi:hypothetical protein
MKKTIVIDKHRAILTGLTILLIAVLIFGLYSFTVGSSLLPASLTELLAGWPGRMAKPDTQVAEALAIAEVSTELYRNPGAYADLVTPELMHKLQLTAIQVLPQMQAINFQSRLISIEGIEVEELEDGQYQVLVHGEVEIQGDDIPKQTREGTATVLMAKVDGRWLATEYRSFGSE